MRASGDRWLAVGVPVAAGAAVLAAAILLLPGRREVLHVERRAHPVVSVAVPPPATPAPVIPATRPPAPPAIADVLRTADAARLAAMTQALIDAGQQVTTLQIAYDLAAAGRGAVALDYLARRPDGDTAATWPLRIDLLRKSGRGDAAAALLARTVGARSGVPVPAIVAAAYALDRPDLLVTAAARGAIPRPDAALTLDLVRRLEKQRRYDAIAALTRIGGDWRRADPWTAIRVAGAQGDRAGALAAAGWLPAAQRDAAREAIMTKAGDRVALRALLLARADAGGDLPQLAERLLAIGARGDAAALLMRAAAQGGTDTAPARRLLYLLGPRPDAAGVAWLRQRTLTGGVAEQLAWLDAYAIRDRPGDALGFVARHPLADRSEVLLTRLTLANAAGDTGAARGILARLLDGRTLGVAQLRDVTAATPRRVDPAQAAALARARIAAGIALPRDRIDLAWSAWNGGDAPRTALLLRDHLSAQPDDVPALRLMADAQAKAGGAAAAARPWLERALARTPQDVPARAELLDRLGRGREALVLVERLRQEAPDDAALARLHARLLIAQGQPGRARLVLAQ